MQIKRFEAKDMTTALKMIKKELGPEAVILSARSLKVENRILGSIKTAGVEVTAATDTYHRPGAAHTDPYAAGQSTGDRRAHGKTPKNKVFMHAVQKKIKSFAQRREPDNSVEGRRIGITDIPADFFQHLLSQGVKHSVAKEMVEALDKKLLSKQSDFKEIIVSKVTEVLKGKRNTPIRPSQNQSEPKVMAFIGPTGVGKTTAIAKLAALQAIQRHKKVALITIDSYRIAAAEELKVYAKAIGIPMKVAGTPSALMAAINEFGNYDFILVDTPGINAKNSSEIDDLNSYLKAIRPVDIHLLLSAGGKEADLFNIIERLSAVNLHYLIFTKLDESITVGNLINFLSKIQLPLSFMTTGRQVPDAITTGSIEKIVRQLMATYPEDLRLPASEGRHPKCRHHSDDNPGDKFVANKNSDVFHHPACKWTQKIKPNNMIMFSSLQDATAQRFAPCRDCQPGSTESIQTGYSENERMRISSYL